MKKHIAILLAWASTISLLSCSDERAEELSVRYEAMSELSLPPPIVAYDKESEVENRKLIRRATLKFEVTDLRQSYDSIKLLTAAAQGYFANEERSETDTRKIQDMMVRVPENNFDAFVSSIEGISRKIVSRNVTTQDVTAEAEDLTVRLKTKKAMENQYNEILRQAKTVKDMLAIEEQLGIVREEIESMETRKRVMDKQIAYSVIDLSMFQVTAAEPGYGSRLTDAVFQGWQRLTDMVFGLVAYWHMLILLIPVAWGVRALYRRATRSTVTTEVTP